MPAIKCVTDCITQGPDLQNVRLVFSVRRRRSIDEKSFCCPALGRQKQKFETLGIEFKFLFLGRLRQ